MSHRPRQVRAGRVTERRAEPTHAFDGVGFEQLGLIGYQDWEEVPVGSLAISLRRTVLPAGSALPPYPVSPSSPELLVVESGTTEVRDYLPDGTYLGPVFVEPGGVVPLPYRDQGTRSIQAGSEALSFLSLTIAPVETEDAAVDSPWQLGERSGVSWPIFDEPTPLTEPAEPGSVIYRADASTGFAACADEWRPDAGLLINAGNGESVIFAPPDLGATVDHAVEAEMRVTGPATISDGRIGLVVRGGDQATDVRAVIRTDDGSATLSFGTRSWARPRSIPVRTGIPTASRSRATSPDSPSIAQSSSR